MVERIKPGTPDGTEENVERIAELFPEVVTEVEDADGNLEHVVDFDALRDLLGDVAEGQRERYQFTWPGKAAAKAEARKPIWKTMRPEPEKSVDWDTTKNLYIEGDNLDALKLLKETYAGQVKLIYIDPPYNTGHDFVYDDDYRKTHEEYDAESGDYDEDGGRLVANPDSNGCFHSDWCSMIYPRLVLARDLLSADGAIFISIDDNESANLRKICDEVFGAGNFVGDVIWQKTYSPRNDSKGIPAEVEHILAYSKSSGWMPGRLPRTTEMDNRYTSPDGDPRPWSSGDAAAPGAASHHGMVYAIQHPITGELLYPPNGRHRPLGSEQMYSIMSEWAEYEFRDLHDQKKRAEICGCTAEEMNDGVCGIVLKNPTEKTFESAKRRYEKGSWPRLYFTNGGRGGMRMKRYLDEMGGKLPTNLWRYEEVGHTDEAKKHLKQLFDGSAPFDTPKPVRLLDRILTIASDKGSLVLDFFSGSATTAEAVMRKNVEDGGTRRFMLVQLPEVVSGGWGNLCNVGEERIRRAGKKIAAEVEESNRQLKLGEGPKPVPDIGFRVLRIDSSNMEDTYRRPGETDQMDLLSLADNVKLDRTPEDLLFEVLPKFRIPYSARIEKRELGGRECFLVDGNRLVACFDTEVGTETIEEMAKLEPDYAVMRDASMRDDATQANFEELFKTYSPDTVRRVI